MRDQIIGHLESLIPTVPLELISQGAEALVFTTTQHPYLPEGVQPLGLSNTSKYIIKYRPPKPYRHPKLDKHITASRTGSEAKLMNKLVEMGVNAPKLVAVDGPNGLIWMEFLGYQLANGDSSSFKNWLWMLEKQNTRENNIALDGEVEKVCDAVGAAVAHLHMNDIVHGDLTSSNIVLIDETHKPSLIDFGLSSYSSLSEDKAVDLYVLERALKSTHPTFADTYNEWILQGYEKRHSKGGKKAIKQYMETARRLKHVRMRGRKRTMIG